MHLSNSIYLGNIDPFISGIDTTDNNILEITANKNWVSIHPVVSCMLVALGLKIKAKGGIIKIEPLEAKSKHYLQRIGIFEKLGIESQMSINEHESAGRFIQITLIKNVPIM